MVVDEIICIECGKRLRHPLCCNYDNASGEFIAPDSHPDHGEFGFQYIGPDCAKKLKIPKSWLSPHLIE